MKKILSLMLCAALCLMSIAAVAETADTYTTASATKTVLAGEAYDAAAAALVAHCADLATLAETKVEGYAVNPLLVNAQIMSVNTDGSVGLSTISQWKYVDGEKDQVIVELTAGQNQINLSKPGACGTLLVKIDGACYLVHLAVVESDEQVFTQEAFDAGEFNFHYSGAPNQLSSFTITCDVTAIEQTYALIF